MPERDEPSKGRQPVPPVTPSKTREEEERKRREDEQKQRDRPAKKVNPETGEIEDAEEAEEEEHPGKPLREDDQMNKFMAPDVKPIGAIYGEDLLQDDPEKRKEMEEPPPETHPQKAQTEPSKAPASR